MSPTAIAALISGIGLVVSLAVTLLVVGVAWGTMRSDIRYLKESRHDLATKDQVDQVAKQVARIDGMFTMSLKSEHGTAA